MITTQQFRPFLTGAGTKALTFWQKINLLYWLQRLPMALLSLPAAYGVAAFASVHLPVPFNILAGMGFESVYLGAVALADQMYDETWQANALWWFLNIAAVIMSALINVLFFSNNTFASITPEAYVHGVPLPVLSFSYALLLHYVANKQMIRIIAEEKEQKRLDELTKEKCKYCGEGKSSMPAIYGHYRNCQMKLEHDSKSSANPCKCLLCNPKV